MGKSLTMTNVYIYLFTLCVVLFVVALFYFGLSYEKKDKKNPSS